MALHLSLVNGTGSVKSAVEDTPKGQLLIRINKKLKKISGIRSFAISEIALQRKIK